MVIKIECNILDEGVCALYSVRITFSDLYSKVLPIKPTRLLAYFTKSEQFLSGLSLLVIVIPKSFSWLTLESSEPLIVYLEKVNVCSLAMDLTHEARE